MNILHFSENEYQEGTDLRDQIGIRGKNLMELAALKAPISPGFIIPSEVIWGKNFAEDFSIDAIKEAVEKIEGSIDKKFNSSANPMLFKVVLSPSIQIVTMPSIHALGLSDEVVKGFSDCCGSEFAYGEYFYLMRSIGSRFMNKNSEDFDEIKKSSQGSIQEICQLCRKQLVPDFPQDGYQQLQLVLTSMASKYTEGGVNEDIEAGLIVQAMVYGNSGEHSYNGYIYSRDIVTGKDQIHGIFGHNEFDIDVDKGMPLSKIDNHYFEQLKALTTQLEEKYLDIRKIKFIIEEKKVWLLDQSPVEEKSTQAEIRTLLDIYAKGLISKEKLAMSVPPKQIQDLLHPIIDYASAENLEKIVGGLTGSPGAVVGKICFSTKKLLAEHRNMLLAGQTPSLILAVPHTDVEDVESIELGRGVIASEGGYSSHAPVVSRSLQKTCVLFPDAEFGDGYVTLGGHRINEMDTISVEAPTYTSPTIWIGEANLIFPDTSKNGLEEYVKNISDLTCDLRVTSLMSKLSDIDTAMRLGSQGIGMCPMDLVIKDSIALEPFQELLLLVNTPKHFDQVADQFSETIQPLFEELLNKLDGNQLVIRLLEGPPTTFFPSDKEKLQKLVEKVARKYDDLSEECLLSLINQMQSINPLMGMRGSRMGINYPHLYTLQLIPLLKAAYEISKNKKVCLGVCVPGVVGDAELRFLRYGRSIESTVIDGMRNVIDDLLKEWKLNELPFNFRIGSVIELPAAAMMAGHLAKQSDFFLIDAMKLTQNASGITIEDLNVFLPAFTQYDIWQGNPFEIFSTPVKELISIVVHLGRLTRPDLQIGISSDNIQDTKNMEFAFQSKVHFVATRPQGIPVARLAIAQYVVKRNGYNKKS